MDPRMDNGVVLDDSDVDPSTRPPLFDPQALLSVEEICWILDRLIAAEVSWNAYLPSRTPVAHK